MFPQRLKSCVIKWFAFCRPISRKQHALGCLYLICILYASYRSSHFLVQPRTRSPLPRLQPNLSSLLREHHARRFPSLHDNALGDNHRLVPPPGLSSAFLTEPLPTCRYPTLNPFDENIRRLIDHPRTVDCGPTKPDLAWFDTKGYLHVDVVQYASAISSMGGTPASSWNSVQCAVRGIGGSLGRDRIGFKWVDEWTMVADKKPIYVARDQVVVRCINGTEKGDFGDATQPANKDPGIVYDMVHAKITPLPASDLRPSSERHPSLIILGIDSVSLNQFRRHMHETRRALLGLGAIFFESYMKVGDNSMPNLIPILTGKRIHEGQPGMPSDFPEERRREQIDAGEIPWLWNRFKDAGCATMYDDDVKHHGRGLFHYPYDTISGFSEPPTHHYVRPHWVYLRASTLAKPNKPHCYGGEPIFARQLGLIRQFTSIYAKKCSYSFSWITDPAHDAPNDVEIMDDPLASLIRELNTTGRLDDSFLILMGDHGQRVSGFKYSYIGKLEARRPLMSILIPKYWERRHPDAVAQLRFNAGRRLTCNFDIYETLNEIFGPSLSDYNHMSETSGQKRSKSGGLNALKSNNQNNAGSNLPLKINSSSDVGFVPTMNDTKTKPTDLGAYSRTSSISQEFNFGRNHAQLTSYPSAKAHGSSLFQPIEPGRSCFAAGVPVQFCTCLEPLPKAVFPVEPEVTNNVARILHNFLTEALRYNRTCKVPSRVTVSRLIPAQFNDKVMNDYRQYEYEGNGGLQKRNIKDSKSGQNTNDNQKSNMERMNTSNSEKSTLRNFIRQRRKSVSKFSTELERVVNKDGERGSLKPDLPAVKGIIFFEADALVMPGDIEVQALVQLNLNLDLYRIAGPIRIANNAAFQRTNQCSNDQMPICWC